MTTEGMVINVAEGTKVPGYGETVNIEIVGAAQTVQIEIFAEDGELVEALQFPASAQGQIKQPGIIPNDLESGSYTIKATDVFNSA